MKTSTPQIREKLQARQESLHILRHSFIMAHVPRFYRLLMEKFPQLVPWFNYSIASNEDDETKLTLLRNKKVIARNF